MDGLEYATLRLRAKTISELLSSIGMPSARVKELGRLLTEPAVYSIRTSYASKDQLQTLKSLAYSSALDGLSKDPAKATLLRHIAQLAVLEEVFIEECRVDVTKCESPY
jgi:hypothetical protein